MKWHKKQRTCRGLNSLWIQPLLERTVLSLCTWHHQWLIPKAVFLFSQLFLGFLICFLFLIIQTSTFLFCLLFLYNVKPDMLSSFLPLNLGFFANLELNFWCICTLLSFKWCAGDVKETKARSESSFEEAVGTQFPFVFKQETKLKLRPRLQSWVILGVLF